jgi:hypothetical protein
MSGSLHLRPMLRVRLVSIGFLLAMAIGFLFWPVVLTYTFLLGEPATAQVSRCGDPPGRASLKCFGTWRTESGSTGSGQIYGLDEDDAGREVQVRIGPMGPYGGGFGHSWVLFATSAPIVFGPPLAVVMIRRMSGPGRKLAAELLAKPAQPGELLIVTRERASFPDGRPWASAHDTGTPPWYRNVRMPGRARAQVPVSTFDQMAGLAQEKTTFWEARRPDGRPIFVIDQRSGGEREPESVLLDPAGGLPQAIIRRVSAYPASWTLLRPDGSLLGSIVPIRGAKWGAFSVREAGGREWALVAARMRECVVRMHPGAPLPYPDLVLAFAFDALRRPPR